MNKLLAFSATNLDNPARVLKLSLHSNMSENCLFGCVNYAKTQLQR